MCIRDRLGTGRERRIGVGGTGDGGIKQRHGQLMVAKGVTTVGKAEQVCGGKPLKQQGQQPVEGGGGEGLWSRRLGRGLGDVLRLLELLATEEVMLQLFLNLLQLQQVELGLVPGIFELGLQAGDLAIPGANPLGTTGTNDRPSLAKAWNAIRAGRELAARRGWHSRLCG